MIRGNRTWYTSLAHYVAGSLTALSYILSPILTLIGFFGFIAYEVDEDWHIRDMAFRDIGEFMVGFFVTVAVILGVKFIFPFLPL